MIDFNALENAKSFQTPFRFLIANGAISDGDAANVRRDFPSVKRSGFLPLSKLDAKGAFSNLITDLQSVRLAEILADKLKIDLMDKPRMITVRRLSKKEDGRIHNDSVAKICTMLVYLNETWDREAGGAVRALNGPDDMENYAAEVSPLAGNVFAFARSETSWHGHPPFAGERFVVQTTFLTSQAELDRKENRGGLQYFMKKINPFAK